MSKPARLLGQRFERLTVSKIDRIDRYVYWECLCDCGNIVIATTGNLRSGNTRSCGCFKRDNPNITVKHGLSQSDEYRIWRGIKDRCRNPTSKYYDRYGGCGIDVCDEWYNSFETFYRDMGPRPSPDHSIDREENDKGYSKGNCRWATPTEQANNRRNNVYYEFDGERKTLTQWCREFRVERWKLQRLIKSGMSLESALDSVIASN